MNEGEQSTHQQAFAHFQLTLEVVKCPILRVLDDAQNQTVTRGREQC